MGNNRIKFIRKVIIINNFIGIDINNCYRTDNSVKNHFYSRLRKGLRKLNKIISYKYKKSYK